MSSLIYYEKLEDYENQVKKATSYDKLKKENQQLKKQLKHKYNNFPKTVKNLSREQLESLYLDLLHIENKKSQQLKQICEVLNND